MHSLRKWFYKPKREDTSKLAQFYWADEELNFVAQELDSFDGRSDPDRCSLLVSQLRSCQDKVLTICNEIMDEVIPKMRANRDFRAKFPDDVLRENIVGQLWFGAECLAAGSNIIHREVESAGMRPLAKALTRALDTVRSLLREQSLKNNPTYSDKIKESLKIFDKLFAEFELSYVSAMVPVKSSKEYHLQQEIIVLFSETLQRALQFSLVSQGQVDEFDPALMFAIPRLAIVWGLLVYPEGPLNVDASPSKMSELFRPFHALLYKIRDLLWTLNKEELAFLEKMLCSLEDPQATSFTLPSGEKKYPSPNTSCPEEMDRNHTCKQFIHDFYTYNFGSTGDHDGTATDADIVLAHSELHPTSRAVAANETPSMFPSESSQVSNLEENLPTMQVEVSLSQKDHIEDLCFCGDDEDDEPCFSEEVAVSRTVLSNVMQRVEIVPPANMHMPSSSRPLINCPLHLSLLDSHSSPSPLPPQCNSPHHRGETSEPQCIPSRRILALRQTSDRTSTTSCSTSYASSPASRCTSPDTSPYDSECPPDDAELALALQAAEIATCHQARARFRSTEELLHRLFVCIAGVADQLQTNFASDLRNILKCVFDMNSSSFPDASPLPSSESDNSSSSSTTDHVSSNNEIDVERDSIDSAEEVMPDEPASPLSPPTSPSEPPTWVPDTESDHCMACTAVFTLLRRRHHCRNCGRLFCARCSSNTIPLPRFGHHKPVRVCDECFRYQLTPFTMQQSC